MRAARQTSRTPRFAAGRFEYWRIGIPRSTKREPVETTHQYLAGAGGRGGWSAKLRIVERYFRNGKRGQTEGLGSNSSESLNQRLSRQDRMSCRNLAKPREQDDARTTMLARDSTVPSEKRFTDDHPAP